MKIYAVNELIFDNTNGDSYSNTLKCFKSLDEAKSYVKDIRANELISDYSQYDEDEDFDDNDDISEDEVDTDFDFFEKPEFDIEKSEYDSNDPTELYSYCMAFIDKDYKDCLAEIELKVQEIDYLE